MAITTINSLAIPAGTVVSADLTYPLTGFSSTGIDDNATSTAITINASENVGIGTANPGRLLHLESDAPAIRIKDTSGTGTIHELITSGTNGNLLNLLLDAGGAGTSPAFIIKNVGTELMRITSSGNVGINASNPTEKLQISGNALVGGEVESVASGTTTGFKWGQDTSTHYWKWAEFNNEAASLQENSTSSAFSRIAIAAGGNVGIGEVSPAQKLDVNGTAVFGGATTRLTTYSDSTYSGIFNGSSLTSDESIYMGNDSIFFYGAGTERMRIDSNGQTMLSGSTAAFDNTGAVNGLQFHYTTTTGKGVIGTYSSGGSTSLAFRTNSGGAGAATDHMVIDSSGNVGIGTTSPNASLHISQNPAVLALGSTGSSDPRFDFYDQGTTTIGASIFLDQSEDILCLLRTASGSATDGIRIDSSGNLRVGTPSQINSTKTGIFASSTTNCLGLQNTNNSNYLITAFNSSSTEVFRVAGDGDVINTNNSYGAISDERLKSNIVDASSQIDDIMAVQVRSYTLDSTGDTHIGVVAQELEASGMSGLVQTDKEGMKSVKYSVLYMKAIKALQEAVTRIETLEAEVAALKGA